MTIKPFNVKAGLSVGTSQIIDVIDANANATVNTLTVNTRANLGTIANVHIDGGSTDYLLKTDGAGNLSWTAPLSATSIINGTSNVNVEASGNVTTSVAGTANVFVVAADGITVAGKSRLGDIANVVIAGGTADYLLKTDGAGNLAWTAPPSTSAIINGTSNVSIDTANGSVTTSVGGTSNVLTVTSAGANISGDLSISGKTNLNAVGNITITGGLNTQILATDGAGNLAWVDQPIGVLPTIEEFVGNGTTATYTLATTPLNENYLTVVIDGVTQLHNTYSLAGNVLTLGGVLPTSAAMEVTILSGGNTLQVEVGNGTSHVSVPVVNSNVEVTTAGTNTWTFDTTGNITLPSNSSQIKYANGSAYAPATANFASYAGNVTVNAQPNITSVGTLTSLAVAGNITSVDAITFDIANAVAVTAGQMSWNDGDGTLDIGLKGGNVTLQVGLETLARVYNAESTALVDGEIVYISGAQGNRIKVMRAIADAETYSAGTLGMVTETIAAGTEGFITTMGTVHGLDTTGLTQGALVFLSPTIAGAYTTTKPTAPDHTVIVGYVERVHAVQGSIYVKVDNGYELEELHNVKITTPTAGQALVYDSANSLWINGTAATANTALSVAGANVTGQVGNALVAGTVYTAAQPNITSTGTLTSLTVSGNANVGNIGATDGVFTGNVTANNLTTTNRVTAGNGITVTTGGITATGNIDVTGNFNVTGNLNYTNVSDLVVGDPLIYIGADNPGNLLDLGTVASYNDGSYKHTGLARNHNDGYWTFFDGVVAEPTTVIDWANAAYPTVKMGNVVAIADVSAANIVSSAYVIRSVNTGISAAGTTQGTATALTKEINVVSTVTTPANGVVLPTAVAGMTITITNTSANTMTVYPASGAAINSLATNTAFSQAAGTTLQFVAPTSTQWYIVGAVGAIFA